MTNLELDNFSKGRHKYISFKPNVKDFRRYKLKSVEGMELGIVRIWLHMMLLLSSCGWEKLCKCLPFSHNKKS